MVGVEGDQVGTEIWVNQIDTVEEELMAPAVVEVACMATEAHKEEFTEVQDIMVVFTQVAVLTLVVILGAIQSVIL